MAISIGENIRIMRRKCGFTQEELAQRLSVTAQAVSKWENGNGLPDISQLVPLAQIFGITTDSLLGCVSAVYGDAHTEQTEKHIELLMSTSKPAAEKHLAVYTYLRAESEKEPTNYDIMRRCIEYAAMLSSFAHLQGFMSDRQDELDEIFNDCERKNACISRYCEDRIIIEKSDHAMAWIYIHTKKYDKAKALIDRLPSLEGERLKEPMMSKLVFFQYGFESQKEVIKDNIQKLMCAAGKEFFYAFENYAWCAAPEEALEFERKISGVLDAFSAFEWLKDDIQVIRRHILELTPRVYAASGDMDGAGKETEKLAQLCRDISSRCKDMDCRKALSHIETALMNTDEKYRDMVKASDGCRNAFKIAEGIDHA